MHLLTLSHEKNNINNLKTAECSVFLAFSVDPTY